MTTVALLLLSATQASPAPDRPNVVIINVDDLGTADIGPFGSTLNRTPHLDRMAKEGLRFTSFYAAPVCSPSRAALMTGCYAKRALPIPHVLFPVGGNGLAPGELTIAEVLKSRGYATAIVGKWHLGDQPEFLPTRQGFDEWFGLPYSNDMGPPSDGTRSNFGAPLPKDGPKPQPPLPLLRNETVLQRVKPEDQVRLVELYTQEAVRFIRAKKDAPFFLYVPHSSVHFPLYPGDGFRGKSGNGLYGDWVEETDASVGRVLDAIREAGIASRTLVIFTSDNGGTSKGLNTPFRGHKGSTLEGGMRVPTIAWWPGRVPAGAKTDVIAGMLDVLPTLARLSGAELPKDRKIDGVDLVPVLEGREGARGREDFLFYRGLKLEAVRSGPWKLHLAKGELYRLDEDPGEAKDVAAGNPKEVERLRALAEATKDDLGQDGIGPGCRPLGKVEQPKPLIDQDGTVREGFRPK